MLTTATDPEGTESNGWHFRASGHDAQMRCPTDELLSIDLWCSRCRKSHPMCVNGAFDAARQRRKVVQLASEGRVDAFWSVT
ncbi:MAG: hypothetical protein INR66_26200 [Gordonia polyisoprenivorans]|nr:hypothetical protein [Gordonia polyisoprenivorans]